MGSSRRAGIRDVAAAAGVSTTTVSHALSGKGRLPVETRERVRRAAERLGYSPNNNARGLVTGRSKLVAIQASGFGPDTLIPGLAFATDIVNAASSAALDRGYALVVLPPEAPIDYLRRFSFDGALVIDPSGQESLLGAMSSQGKPVVTIGRLINAASSLPFVDADHGQATRDMLDHLWANGYRRPAILTGGRGMSYVESIVSAYRWWCTAMHIPERVIELGGPLTESAGERAVDRALRVYGTEVDSIYATLDVLAVGALAAADELGITVPQELGLASIIDSALVRASRPKITSYDLHSDEHGRRAVGMLMDIIEDVDSPASSEPIAVDLKVRPSTQKTRC